MEEQYQDVLRGDVTNTLNWLLRELADSVVAYRYLPANATLFHSSLDRALKPREMEQIRLSDGGSKASRLVFAAADGRPLQPHWPLVMRRPEFGVAEETYECTPSLQNPLKSGRKFAVFRIHGPPYWRR